MRHGWRPSNSRTFEEFLISGAAFHKESFGWRDNKMDCWTDIISPNHIFLFRCLEISYVKVAILCINNV